MLVAGDHARNDMAGEHDGSWKNCLQAAGFSVKILMKGLGEESGIQEIFVRHALDASLFL